MKVFKNKQQCENNTKKRRIFYFIDEWSSSNFNTREMHLLPSGVQNVPSKCNCMQIVSWIDGKMLCACTLYIVHTHQPVNIVGSIIVILCVWTVFSRLLIQVLCHCLMILQSVCMAIRRKQRNLKPKQRKKESWETAAATSPINRSDLIY